MIKVWIDLYNENMPHNAHILHCYVIGNERKVFCRIKKKKERGGESESERLNSRKLYTKRYHLWKNRWCRKKEKINLSKFRGLQSMSEREKETDFYWWQSKYAEKTEKTINLNEMMEK